MGKAAFFAAALFLNIPIAAPAVDGVLSLPGASRDPAAMEAQGREMMKQMITAAEKGSLEAQKNLSFMFMTMTTASDEDIKESGFATSLSDALDKGVAWMHKAAEQGDMESQSKLGTLYMGNWKFGPHGELTMKQDMPEAVKWFKLAAEQGDANAQSNLGSFYLTGVGVEKDLIPAYKWSYLASKKYPRINQEAVARVAEQMNASQIIEAERLANEWLSTHKQ